VVCLAVGQYKTEVDLLRLEVGRLQQCGAAAARFQEENGTNARSLYAPSTIVFSSMSIGPPPPSPTPSPERERVPSPPEPKGEGGAHSPAGEGVGESQLQSLEKKLSTLSTL
jgi:hypothetical protein